MSGISDLLDLVDLPCGGGRFINQRLTLYDYMHIYIPTHTNIDINIHNCWSPESNLCMISPTKPTG